MYRSFRLEGFRSHTEASFENCGVVNVITGLNDAGKTSVLEAIFLHASGAGAGAFAIQTLRPGRRQEEIAITADGMDDPWDALFHNFDTSNEIRLSAKTESGVQTVTLGQGGSVDGQVAFGSRPITDNKQPNRAIRVSVADGSAGAPVSYRQSMVILQGTNAIGPTVSVEFRLEPPNGSALRKAAIVKPGVLGADLAAGYSEMRRRRAGAVLLEAVQAIDARITQLEVLATNGRSQLHAEVNGQLVPFELLGDGPNAVAQYLVSMWGARDGVLLIDEIGSGVHYSVLETMWRTLYRAAERLSVQVFATTHSLEALTAAHSVLRDRQDSLVVYRMRRGKTADEPTRVTAYWGSTLEAAIDANAELR